MKRDRRQYEVRFSAEPASASADRSLEVGQDKSIFKMSDRKISPAAERALKEAAERRQKNVDVKRPHETGGPAGPEPTRYGDWERKGIASDF